MHSNTTSSAKLLGTLVSGTLRAADTHYVPMRGKSYNPHIYRWDVPTLCQLSLFAKMSLFLHVSFPSTNTRSSSLASFRHWHLTSAISILLTTSSFLILELFSCYFCFESFFFPPCVFYQVIQHLEEPAIPKLLCNILVEL